MGEEERERNFDVRVEYPSAASCTPPTWDLARNLGTGPYQESNQHPLGSLGQRPTT